jgi:hypothetical protein
VSSEKVEGRSEERRFMMKLRIAMVWMTALLALAAGQAFSQGLEFSGVLDSSVAMRVGAGDAPALSWGIEEYANLRMRANLREGAVFYGALNLSAVSGISAQNAAGLGALNAAAYPGMAGSSFTAGENYAAAIEPERLYLRVNGEYLDLDAGLMRLAFGYGQVWGPSDFLNPRSPLFPDARPRAVLGAALSVYPAEDLKLLGFGAAPKNPFESGGGGYVLGLSGDRHWERASLQALYAFETPAEGTPSGIHRGGLSLKADLELGFLADLLYTLDPDAPSGLDGLAASAGADYSFFDGNCYVLAEYLYSGAESVSARSRGGYLANRHYLYGLFRYGFSDYTSASLACTAALGDLSFLPALSLDHELLQGLTLSLSARLPLDRDLFSGDGRRGELGPLPPDAPAGTRLSLDFKARLRF